VHMVTNFWKSHPPATSGNIVEDFAHNLIEMKRLSKIWAHNKRIKDDQTLMNEEKEIVELENCSTEVYKTNEHKDNLTELYATRGKILKDHKEAWRVRSRVTWQHEGDDNTKFCHKYANGQKAINTI